MTAAARSQERPHVSDCRRFQQSHAKRRPAGSFAPRLARLIHDAGSGKSCFAVRPFSLFFIPLREVNDEE